MSRRGWLWSLGALLLVASCGGTTANTDPAPAEATSDSAWGRVLDGIEEAGVPLDVALQAFSLAIGDLPGVDVPDGDEVDIPSGSGAIRWLLGHWDELTPEQKEAAQAHLDALLGVAEPTGAGSSVVLAMTGLPVAAAADEQAILGLIDQVEAEIAANLGRELGVPIELHLAPNLNDPKAMATATPTDATGGFFGPMAKCTITITKSGMKHAEAIDNGVASDELTALMAHETFHCFEAALSTNIAESHARPSWVVEGLAEWAGETVAGGSELAAWDKWLELPLASLYKREYSAIGFYAHLQEHGANVWLSIDDIIQASNGGNESAYTTAIGAAGPDVLATWGPGTYRDPTRAPIWDQDGPGIKPLKYQAQTAFAEVATGSSIAPFAEALAADIWTTSLSAQVVTIAGSGHGMILLPDGAELALPDALGTVLCTDPGGCTCPEDSPGADVVFRLTEPGETRIGLTGHLGGTKLEIEGWDLETFCDEEPGGCFVGIWETVSYSAIQQEILTGTGSGIAMVIDDKGQGMIDFNDSIPIWSRMTFEDAPWVRVTQVGTVRFQLDPSQASALVAGGVASGYHISAEVQLGDNFVEAGPGMSISGPSFGPGASLVCEGDTVTWTAPGAVSEYVFQRISTETEELPPPPEDGEPLGGDGGGESGEGGGLPPTPPPDWGLDIDACNLIGIDEIKSVFPTATDAAGEDDISTQYLHQCTYSDAFFLQVTPPQPPEMLEGTASSFDLDVVVEEGIGDWARAFLNQDDPEFGITGGSVFMLAAGNAQGTVTLVMWGEVVAGTPEYQALLDLLATTLSRL